VRRLTTIRYPKSMAVSPSRSPFLRCHSPLSKSCLNRSRPSSKRPTVENVEIALRTPGSRYASGLHQ
jgi:hypothetical protein